MKQQLACTVSPTFEWIRLAQRVPVRIQMTKILDGVALRVGTTASVLVMTGTAEGGMMRRYYPCHQCCGKDAGMKRSLQTIGFATLSALIASGCAMLGPDFQEPSAPVESDWIEVDDPLVSSELPADPKWWQTAFQDPVLDQLVEMALQENLTLRSAALRVLQSQQQLAIAIGNQYPQQQQATGLAAREKSNTVIFNDYSLGLNLSWEVDFWGRFRRQVESASA